MANNIEVEIQTFLSPTEAKRVRTFFNKRARFMGSHRDSTTYFEKNGRVRIRIEPRRAYFVFKGGVMHDHHREEVEIPFDKKFVPLAERFLIALGFPVTVGWFRKREKWLWKGVTVTLDDSKGYGKLLELEKMASLIEKGRVYQMLRQRLTTLRLQPTPRKELNKRFRHYLKHWKMLTKA